MSGKNMIQVGGFLPAASKNADGQQQPIIIQQINVRPVNRQPQDITKWRNAHKSAEGLVPRRTLLYDLYADVMLDGHVIAVTQKLVDAVTNADWQFVDKDGAIVEEVQYLMDSLGFNDLLTELANEEMWGYSMVECDFYKDFNNKWVMSAYQCPRKHMRPEQGLITFDQTGDNGINIREGIYPNFVLESGTPKNLGLLLAVAQYAIFKDGGMSDWALFVQTFGIPLLTATWNGFDDDQRQKLSDSINGLGPGGNIIHPAGTEIKAVESAKANGEGKMQQNFVDQLNKEISKVVLGSTEGTEASKSSGYAQANTHEQVEEKRKASLLNKIRRTLNSRFIRIMEANGINTNGGSFTVKPKEEQLGKKDAYEVHKSMRTDLGIPIDDDFFYKTYNVAKPDDYESQKAALEAKKAQNTPIVPEPPKPENARTPPVKPKDESIKPKTGEGGLDNKPKLSFKLARQMVASFFALAPAQPTTGAVPMMNCCGNHLTLSLKSSFDDTNILQSVYDAGGNYVFDADVYFFTVQTLLDGFKNGWDQLQKIKLADLGFDYGLDDPAMLTAFEMNLFRFSGTKTLAQVQALNELYRKAKSFEDFYRDGTAITQKFNKAWQEVEYNTATLVGESAATYSRLMQQVDIFPYWEYKTVGDAKVRPEHAALNGLILPYNDPRWNSLYPPNGWNCRCYIVPRTKAEFAAVDLQAMRARADSYFESAEFKSDAAQGWGVNRVKAGEVFTANQQYIRKFPQKANAKINSLGASDYGLPSYSQAKKIATTDLPKYSGTADAFRTDNNALLTDYQGRKLPLTEGNYKAHTTGKKTDRVPYLNAMQQTLLNPDEVWLNGTDFRDLVYLKYYNGETMIVLADLTNSNLTEVSTWFPLAEKKVVIERYRRGLLVKGGKK